jgi:hypothetical protein
MNTESCAIRATLVNPTDPKKVKPTEPVQAPVAQAQG